MDVVTSTISIVDIVKQLHKTIMDDNPKFETIPESREKINNLLSNLTFVLTLEPINLLFDLQYIEYYL